MRHARDQDLKRVEPLLEKLNDLAGEHDVLKRRKRGVYYLGSRAFLHFHEHDGEIHADVRLDGVDFDRFKVTTRADQKKLVSRIKGILNE